MDSQHADAKSVGILNLVNVANMATGSNEG